VIQPGITLWKRSLIEQNCKVAAVVNGVLNILITVMVIIPTKLQFSLQVRQSTSSFLAIILLVIYQLSVFTARRHGSAVGLSVGRKFNTLIEHPPLFAAKNHDASHRAGSPATADTCV